MNTRKLRIWILSVLILGLVISMVVLEQGRQDEWTIYSEEGLIMDRDVIALDETGRAWIDSYEGVKVFDGETWITYNVNNSGLLENSIRNITFDQQGRVWIGTHLGINVFDGETWITYTSLNSGLVDNLITDIGIDQQGRAWIGTMGYGVSVFDGETWITYDKSNSSLPGGGIAEIAFDKEGRIWIGSHSAYNGPGGVSVFDGATSIYFNERNSGLVNNDVETIAIDEAGHAWIGTREGISVYDGETWITYTANNSGLVDNYVGDIVFDPQGRAWITPYGVTIFDGETWVTYTSENSGLSEDSGVVAFDPQGRAWIGGWHELSVKSLNLTTSLSENETNFLSRAESWSISSLFLGLLLALVFDTFPGILIGMAIASMSYGYYIAYGYEGNLLAGVFLGIGWFIGGIGWEIIDIVRRNQRRQKTNWIIRILLIGIIVFGIGMAFLNMLAAAIFAQ